jgi:hypothetical protein
MQTAFFNKNVNNASGLRVLDKPSPMSQGLEED